MTLAAYLTDGNTGPLGDELAGWLASSTRFRAFADAHRDKIRKKLRSATDADARLDVRTELKAARMLLADRQIALAYEPAGSTRGGPDFAVHYRTHHAFNLEVTRLRSAPDATGIGRVVLTKLRQLPTSSANVLLVAVDAVATEAVLAVAANELRARADAADPALLAHGRFASPRAFYQRYLRLGAVVAWADGAARGWVNPSARIRVPDRALGAVLAALDQRG